MPMLAARIDKNVITMIKRDSMLIFLARLAKWMTRICVRAVLHRVRSRKCRILPEYIISNDFYPDLRKLMLRLSGSHEAAVLSMARRREPLLYAHGTQTDEAGAGGTRRPLLNIIVAGHSLYESLGFEAIGERSTGIMVRWPPSNPLHCWRGKHPPG